jgi:hypothetical protein
VGPLAFARDDKRERLGEIRREQEKFKNNKIKKGGSLRVCSRT